MQHREALDVVEYGHDTLPSIPTIGEDSPNRDVLRFANGIKGAACRSDKFACATF